MRTRAIDWWRRSFPGHPRIDRTAFYPSHSELPGSLARHQLALVGGSEERPKWAVFECPCGTGHRIAVPLDTRRQQSWQVTLKDNRRPSLRPSIDSNDGRRCHFWLRHGKIQWAPDRRRGRRGVPL